MNKMKPCPLCGNEDIKVIADGNEVRYTKVMCPYCGFKVDKVVWEKTLKKELLRKLLGNGTGE
jgi:DNA-directed RNA polymerase subunit RPC12/RpoP